MKIQWIRRGAEKGRRWQNLPYRRYKLQRRRSWLLLSIPIQSTRGGPRLQAFDVNGRSQFNSLFLEWHYHILVVVGGQILLVFQQRRQKGLKGFGIALVTGRIQKVMMSVDDSFGKIAVGCSSHGCQCCGRVVWQQKE